MGGLVWVVIGRALHPVEAMRAEAADIGGTNSTAESPHRGTDDEIGNLADHDERDAGPYRGSATPATRFVSDASHELRTPIAVIRHQLEIALRESTVTDWPAVAGSVLEEDLRVQRLIDDLLWLARHDDGKQRAPDVLVDLDEIVFPSGSPAHATGGSGCRCVGRSPRARFGHADDLTRVVQNLLDNTIRRRVDRVAVVLSGGDHRTVHLHVDDDGPGVPADMRNVIFERFTRSDEARGPR